MNTIRFLLLGTSVNPVCGASRPCVLGVWGAQHANPLLLCSLLFLLCSFWLREVLRDELGHEGVVIAQDEAIESIPGNFSEKVSYTSNSFK